jgi:hypothetical protein
VRGSLCVCFYLIDWSDLISERVFSFYIYIFCFFWRSGAEPEPAAVEMTRVPGFPRVDRTGTMVGLPPVHVVVVRRRTAAATATAGDTAGVGNTAGDTVDATVDDTADGTAGATGDDAATDATDTTATATATAGGGIGGMADRLLASDGCQAATATATDDASSDADGNELGMLLTEFGTANGNSTATVNNNGNGTVNGAATAESGEGSRLLE